MNTSSAPLNEIRRAPSWLHHPGLLLLASGMLIGTGFPLAKLAGQMAIPATAWLTLHALGASLTLLPVLLLQKRLSLPKGRQWRYATIAGPLTFALPNLLVYLTAPQVGAGFSGVMFALSPVCTLALALSLRIAELTLLKSIGLSLGLTGALGMSLTHAGTSAATSLVWVFAAMAIPLVLAAGNLYRSLAWPADSPPAVLAFWSHLLAAVVYGCLTGVLAPDALRWVLRDHPTLALAQMALAGVTAPLVFRLQRVGGPVLLSQMGYVAAAASLVVATLALGETYATSSWLSAGVIGLGVGVAVYANRPRA